MAVTDHKKNSELFKQEYHLRRLQEQLRGERPCTDDREMQEDSAREAAIELAKLLLWYQDKCYDIGSSMIFLGEEVNRNKEDDLVRLGKEFSDWLSRYWNQP